MWRDDPQPEAPASGPLPEGAPAPPRAAGTSVAAAGEWSTACHVTRWQAGDERAFDALHRHFTPLLREGVRHNKWWRLFALRCDVDDVVQEIWSRVLREDTKQSFASRDTGSFLAWLGVVAHNTLNDLGRKEIAQKRGEGAASEPLAEESDARAVVMPGLRPAPTASSSARVAELDAIAQEELSEDEYLAWILVDVRGYTSEEAGTLAMGRSGASVRGLRRRARAKLVRRLEE